MGDKTSGIDMETATNFLVSEKARKGKLKQQEGRWQKPLQTFIL